MARARTGNVEQYKTAAGADYFKARLRLADGSRVRVDIPAKHAGDKNTRASYALARQQLEDEKGAEMKKRTAAAKARAGANVPKSSETVTRWMFDRYILAFKANGHDEKEVRTVFGPWVLPLLGTKPIGSLRREHALAVRAKLVAAVSAGEISPKRACDVFSLFCTAMGRAFTDDDPSYESVRVGPASSNPCLSLKPPFNGKQKEERSKERQWLHPRRFSALMASSAVPVAWRRIHAIAVGLFLRPEELYALTWDDVDLEAEEVSVTKTKDLRTAVVTDTTKCGEDRKVPIVPMLLPLLTQMKKEAHGKGDVAIIPTDKRHTSTSARAVREHLELASVMTDELRKGTSKRLAFDFRSWRTTGCTWHAMNGVDSWVLARWAGHRSPAMTWGAYAKEGPDMRRRYGEPFPTLPDEIINGSGRRDSNGPSMGQEKANDTKPARKPSDNGSGRRDLKAREVSSPVASRGKVAGETTDDVHDVTGANPLARWLAQTTARGGEA